MKKAYNLLIAVAILFTTAAKAQQNPPTSLVEFPMLVILKVNDVTSAVPGISAKQLALANFFNREASLLAPSAIRDLTAVEMASLQLLLKKEFEAILSPQELNIYSRKRRGAVYSKPDSVPVNQTSN